MAAGMDSNDIHTSASVKSDSFKGHTAGLYVFNGLPTRVSNPFRCTLNNPCCNQGMLASVVFQCQRLHLVTSDAELQSNGVNDGGTTESRGLHG